MKSSKLLVRTGSLLVAALGFMMTGCSNSLVGTWENKEKVEGQKFVITNATFKDDGTYIATAKQGDEDATRLAGTYEFDGFNLTLKQPGKPERKYGATYMMMGPALEIRSDGEKQVLTKK